MTRLNSLTYGEMLFLPLSGISSLTKSLKTFSYFAVIFSADGFRVGADWTRAVFRCVLFAFCELFIINFLLVPMENTSWPDQVMEPFMFGMLPKTAWRKFYANIGKVFCFGDDSSHWFLPCGFDFQ
jgi:hypothetical protein